VLRRGEHTVPIFGTTKAARVEENAGALSVQLGPDDFQKLDAIRRTHDRRPLCARDDGAIEQVT